MSKWYQVKGSHTISLLHRDSEHLRGTFDLQYGKSPLPPFLTYNLFIYTFISILSYLTTTTTTSSWFSDSNSERRRSDSNNNSNSSSLAMSNNNNRSTSESHNNRSSESNHRSESPNICNNNCTSIPTRASN